MTVVNSPAHPAVQAPRSPYRPGISIAVGIVAPLACIVLQFVVFGNLVFEVPGLCFLNLYPLLNYSIVALEMFTLAIWVAGSERVGHWCGVVSGVLLAGALFAGLLGLVLLPFSVIGLLVGIGILGLVPLGTAYVFARNGLRAHGVAMATIGHARAWMTVVLGAALAIGVPGAAQAGLSWSVRTAVDGIVRGDPIAAERLRWLPAVLYRDQLALLYADEPDPVRQERLAHAYRKLCGGQIESRLTWLGD